MSESGHRLLIVWWSVTGASRQLSQAAYEGAVAEEAIQVVVRRCDEAGAQDLLDADGYLFVAPENLATLAGIMKDFFDRSYYAVLERLNGRPYAQIISAGSDGTGAARQLARIATGWRLREAVEPLIVVTPAQTPEAILAPKVVAAGHLEQARELGAGLAAGLAMGIW
jgi:multimeric flavodoxin WrbA